MRGRPALAVLSVLVVSADGEEDTIRCVCNLHREEGLMIQCERCLVWQHCDCVDADPAVEQYACEVSNSTGGRSHTGPAHRSTAIPLDYSTGFNEMCVQWNRRMTS